MQKQWQLLHNNDQKLSLKTITVKKIWRFYLLIFMKIIMSEEHAMTSSSAGNDNIYVLLAHYWNFDDLIYSLVPRWFPLRFTIMS